MLPNGKVYWGSSIRPMKYVCGARGLPSLPKLIVMFAIQITESLFIETKNYPKLNDYNIKFKIFILEKWHMSKGIGVDRYFNESFWR